MPSQRKRIVRPFSCGSMCTSLAISSSASISSSLTSRMTEADWAISASSPPLRRSVADDFDAFFDVARDELVDRIAADAELVLDPLQHVFAAGQDRFQAEAAEAH